MKSILLFAIGLLLASSASAQQQWGAKAAEQAMCNASVLGKDKSDGRNWGHMHHYCDGLRFYNRALASMNNRSLFNFNIQESLGGFDYVLRHSTPDFYMRPEVMANKARTLSLAGRKAEAVMLYTSVMQQSPKYVPAYLYLADYYASSDRKKALGIVSDGLRRNPGTKSLQRRYEELGGKLPYPEPLVVPEPVENPLSSTVEIPSAEEVSPNPMTVPQADSETTREEAKIGSPKNPYCRFCPD